MSNTCSTCGKEIPGIAARCPSCGAECGRGLVSIAPPRAKERDIRSPWEAMFAWLAKVRLIGWVFDPSPGAWTPRNPELWLSLLLPGLGHYYLGFKTRGIQIFLGAIIFFLVLGWVIVGPVLGAMLPIFFFGSFLAAVHADAVARGNEKLGKTRKSMGRFPMIGVIAAVIYLQIFFIGFPLLEDLSGTRYQIRISGDYSYWHPTFQIGDVLRFNPDYQRDLGIGDFMLFLGSFPERALGLSGDRLEIRDGLLFRNGVEVTEREERPLMALAADQTYQNQSVTVRAGEIGYLWWGRELRAIPFSSVPGRIEEILAPASRQQRFPLFHQRGK